MTDTKLFFFFKNGYFRGEVGQVLGFKIECLLKNIMTGHIEERKNTYLMISLLFEENTKVELLLLS